MKSMKDKQKVLERMKRFFRLLLLPVFLLHPVFQAMRFIL